MARFAFAKKCKLLFSLLEGVSAGVYIFCQLHRSLWDKGASYLSVLPSLSSSLSLFMCIFTATDTSQGVQILDKEREREKSLQKQIVPLASVANLLPGWLHFARPWTFHRACAESVCKNIVFLFLLLECAFAKSGSTSLCSFFKKIANLLLLFASILFWEQNVFARL